MAIYWNTIFKKKIKPSKEISGLMAFEGAQGTGKTFSMVHYVREEKRRCPGLRVLSNIRITLPDGSKAEQYRSEDVAKILADPELKNAILVVDEIGELFLNNKKGIDISAFSGATQVRKRNLMVVSTIQNFADLQTHIRRHFKILVKCKTLISKRLQFNAYYLADSVSFDVKKDKYTGQQIDIDVFFRTQEIGDSYDTSQLIDAYLTKNSIDQNIYTTQTEEDLQIQTARAIMYSRKE